jgi:nitrate reductase gamma subunit
MNVMLWVVYPYLAIAVMVGGLIWRYRYDKFGWTTRSSQLYETTLLRWGSPLFHFGILMVLVGHIGGLLIPKSWTEAVGITEHTYHLMAVFIGTVAGCCTLIGMALLIVRRRLTGPVFAATTRNDKAMYLVLAAVIVLGLWNTVRANITGAGYDYRENISPWFRSLFYFSPDPDVMAAVPIGFQLHIVAAFALFAFWPFTRLVHAFSAPVGYLTRPYIVYRSRDTKAPLRPSRPGWDGPPQAPSARAKSLDAKGGRR